MKKLQIKTSFQEAKAINELIEIVVLEVGKQTSTYSEKCVLATLESWRMTKLFPKTIHPSENGKVSIKLDAPIAMALAVLVQNIISEPLVIQSQAGNKLNQIFVQIDQHFK